MAQEAIIYEGFYEGSELVSIRCYDFDGVEFTLNQNGQVLGTGVLADSLCQIVVAPLQVSEYDLYLTTNDANFRLLPPQPVVGSDEKLTGWQIPKMLAGEGGSISYEQYKELQATYPEQFRDFPDVYNPSLTINKNPNKDSLQAFAFANIIFSTERDSVYGTTTVTVRGVKNARGGYSIQFDDGVIGSINSKSYTVSGTYKVKVTDLSDSSNFLEESYGITINTTAPPATSIIENIPYIDKGYGENDGIGFVFCYCPEQVQFQVVGVSMAGEQPDGWIDGEGGQNNRWSRIIAGIPSGTQTLRVRVKDDITDSKTTTFIQ